MSENPPRTLGSPEELKNATFSAEEEIHHATSIEDLMYALRGEEQRDMRIQLAKALLHIRDHNESIQRGASIEGLNAVTTDLGLRRAVEDILRSAGHAAAISQYVLEDAEKEDASLTGGTNPSDLAEKMQESRDKREIAAEERAAIREQQAEELAEKFGLTAVRQAFLDAEKKYAEAFLKDKGRMGETFTDEVLDDYVDAALLWRNSLARAVEDADQTDKIKARILAVRDTSLRLSELKQTLKEQTAAEKAKPFFAKLKKWASSAGTGLGYVADKYGKVSEKTGRAFGTGVLGRKLGLSEERIKRAARIAGSAALVSAVVGFTGGVGAAAIGSGFVLRLARGALASVIAVPIGTVTGSTLGKAYAEVAARGNRSAERDRARFYNTTKGGDSFEAEDSGVLAREAGIISRGRFSVLDERRSKQERTRKVIEVGTGTAFSMALAPQMAELTISEIIDPALYGEVVVVNDALEELGPLEEVVNQMEADGNTTADATPAEMRDQLRNTVEEMNTLTTADAEPEGNTTATQDQPEKPQQRVTTTTDDAPRQQPVESARPVSAEISRGEGADSLFFELRDDVQERLRTVYGGDESKLSHAERAILNSDERVLSRSLGFFGDVRGPNGEVLGQGSRIMQPGDTIEIDRQGRLVFVRDGNSQVLIEANGTLKELPPLTPENASGLETSHSSQPEARTEPQPTIPISETEGSQPASAAADATREPDTVSATDTSPADAMSTSPRASGELTIDSVTGTAAPQQVAPGTIPSGNSTIDSISGQGTSGEPASSGRPLTVDSVLSSGTAVEGAVSSEAFENANGLTVDTVSANLYSHVDTKGATVLTIYGGNNPAEAATQYLREHPESVVRYEVADANGEIKTFKAQVNGEGVIERTSPALDADGRPLARLNPDHFTNKTALRSIA